MAARKRNRSRKSKRSLHFQDLETRQLLAGDAPFVDITGLWVSVGNREYFASEQAAVSIDMNVGETLRVTGVRYGVDDSATVDDGVVAFESYVRKEHGAVTGGSYDYTDGRFADPIEGDLVGGSIVQHPGFDSGWELDVVDNRVTVVAIRYFGNDFVVEDRMLIDVNVTTPPDQALWTESISEVRGEWTATETEVDGNSSFDPTDVAGISIIETANPTGELYEVGVKMKSVLNDTYANGFVVVDYRSEDDFIYAGMRTIADQWVIGHFDGQFNDLVSLDQEVDAQHIYDVRVAIDGSHVALASDGVFRISHDFGHPLEGSVGLANQYAYTHFTDFNFFDNDAPPQESEEVRALREIRDREAAELDQSRQNLEQARQNEAEANSQRQAAAQAAEHAATEAENLQVVANQDEVLVRQRTEERNQTQQRLDAATAITSQLENEAQVYSEQLAETTSQIDVAEKAIADANEQLGEFNDTLETVEESLDAAAAALEEATVVRDAAESAANAARSAADAAQEQANRWTISFIRNALQSFADRAYAVAEAADEKLVEAEETLSSIAGEIEEFSTEVTRINQQVADTQAGLLDAEARLDDGQRALEELNGASRELEQRLTEARSESEVAENALLLAEAELERARSEYEQSLITAAKGAADAKNAEDRLEEAELAVRSTAELVVDRSALLEQQQTELQHADEALEAAIAAEQLNPVNSEKASSNAYALNFNHQDDGAFDTVVGSSERVAGQLHLVPESDGSAIAILDESALPDRAATRIYSSIHADALPASDQNGFVVFDYHSPDDFKYAGGWAADDRWAIGEVVDGVWTDIAVVDEVIGSGPAYELHLRIDGNSLEFLVDGVDKIAHTFDDAIDDGQLGIASNDARTRFDQIAVVKLRDVDPPEVAADATDAAISELF